MYVLRPFYKLFLEVFQDKLKQQCTVYLNDYYFEENYKQNKK